MKVFVSGGSGFLGSWLVKALSERGNEVHVLTRKPENAKHLEFPGVKLFPGDIASKESISAAMKGAERVYHLAAFAEVWSRDPETYNRTNAMGTANILDICAELGIKRVLITSSAGNFGPSINGIITESTSRTLPFFNSYESTKAGADKNALENYGDKLDIVIVYPTRIYGEVMRGEPAAATLLIKKLVCNNFRIIPGSGKQIGNYVYVRDVVQGMLLAMDRGGRGEKYILGGINCSYDAFYETSLKLGNKKQRLLHVSMFWLKMILKWEELKAMLGFKPLLTSDWLAKLKYHWEISSVKAQEELGYEITPFDEGMKHTINSLQTKTKSR